MYCAIRHINLHDDRDGGFSNMVHRILSSKQTQANAIEHWIYCLICISKTYHPFILFIHFTKYSVQFSSVQLLSRVQLFATPWIAARQASLSITNSRSSLKLMSIESVMAPSHLILCRPLLLLPPIPPSIRVFYNESIHMKWPKYWSFSFSISPSKEHPGLTSRMDWLDLLAVQGTLKSLLQHHTSKASILRCSAFFTVQLLHPFMTTGKTIGLTRQTFVGKVMLLNMLSRLVITFLPRSKCLLISWLQSLAGTYSELGVMLEAGARQGHRASSPELTVWWERQANEWQAIVSKGKETSTWNFVSTELDLDWGQGRYLQLTLSVARVLGSSEGWVGG